MHKATIQDNHLNQSNDIHQAKVIPNDYRQLQL